VTLEQPGVALTTNFVRVDMAHIREPNRIFDLQINALSATGLRERTLLPVL